MNARHIAQRGLIGAALAVISLHTVVFAGDAEPAVEEKKPKLLVVTEEHRDFLKRADALLAANTFGPAREFVNRLRGPETSRFRQELAKGTAEEGGFSAWQWGEVKNAVQRAENAADWPKMPAVTVPLVDTGTIVIDGKIDEEAWKNAATFTGMVAFNTRQRVDSPAMTWRLLWDAKYLYVAYDCADTTIMADVRDRDADVWADDCVEIFILPDPRYRVYWELVVSPTGSIFDSVQCKHRDLWGCTGDTSQNMEGLKTGITIDGTINKADDTDTGYRVELAIPFDQLPGFTRAPAKEGDTLRFMLVRLDKTPKGMTPYAFQPLLGWGHNIWNHTPMVLGGKP